MSHGGPGATAGEVHDAASAGIAGSGGTLPYANKIQASFGSHDIGAVKAHTDAKAAAATASMGANAYATGNHVAFAPGKSDLHTAAHEAAHVVQQSSGVHLSGGVGEAGDRYERHADAVADKVVAGESAEALLSEMTGGGPTVQRQVVQREEETSEGTKQGNADPANLVTVMDAASLGFGTVSGGLAEIASHIEEKKKLVLSKEATVLKPARDMVARIQRLEDMGLTANHGKMNEVFAYRSEVRGLISRFQKESAVLVEGAEDFVKVQKQIDTAKEGLKTQMKAIEKLKGLGQFLGVAGFGNAVYGFLRSVENAAEKGFRRDDLLDIAANAGSVALATAGLMGKWSIAGRVDAALCLYSANWKTEFAQALAKGIDKFVSGKKATKERFDEAASKALETAATLKQLTHGQRFKAIDKLIEEERESYRRQQNAKAPDSPRECGTYQGDPVDPCPESSLPDWLGGSKYPYGYCTRDGFTKDDVEDGCMTKDDLYLTPENVKARKARKSEAGETD